MEWLRNRGGSPCLSRPGRGFLLVVLAGLLLLSLLGCSLPGGSGKTPTVPAVLLTPLDETPTPTRTPTATALVAKEKTSTVSPEATGTATTQAETETSPTIAADATTYEVQSGDTLSGIAKKFGVSVDEIMAANGLDDPNQLKVGQVLVIPAPGEAPTATADETPVASPQADQGTALYAQQAPLSQIGDWLQGASTMVVGLAVDPSAMCGAQAEAYSGLQQQGEGLLGSLQQAQPPAGLAQQHEQLVAQMAGILESLRAAKVAMCEQSDSMGAMGSLLQVSATITQAQQTLDGIATALQGG